MSMLDQFSAAGTMWVAVIKQARQDLVSRDTRLAIQAARYFFFEPENGDDRDMRTFAGLCAATRVNPDAAAKAIFKALRSEQQKRIFDLLRDAGYEGIRTDVVM